MVRILSKYPNDLSNIDHLLMLDIVSMISWLA